MDSCGLRAIVPLSKGMVVPWSYHGPHAMVVHYNIVLYRYADAVDIVVD